MCVVDTSAWIEWLIKSPTGRKIATMLPAEEDWVVPTIVQFELAKWTKRELGEDAGNTALVFSQMCVVAPLDTEVALLAADVAAQHQLSVADAMVFATARARGARLLTCDSHCEGLPDVDYVRKEPE